MNGAIPPFPRYAFMAWCLVTAQGQIYLYLRARDVKVYMDIDNIDNKRTYRRYVKHISYVDT
jgi:hypothetical protein